MRLGCQSVGVDSPPADTLNETVDAELAALPADMRARLARISELIESVGLLNVKEPHVRHIRSQLW